MSGLLAGMLPLGVAACWDEIDAMGDDERVAYGRGLLERDGYEGFTEALIYRTKNKGESAAEFARLARAVAVMAHQPGGVRVFGLHWEAPDRWPHDCDGPCERREAAA